MRVEYTRVWTVLLVLTVVWLVLYLGFRDRDSSAVSDVDHSAFCWGMTVDIDHVSSYVQEVGEESLGGLVLIFSPRFERGAPEELATEAAWVRGELLDGASSGLDDESREELIDRHEQLRIRSRAFCEAVRE